MPRLWYLAALVAIGLGPGARTPAPAQPSLAERLLLVEDTRDSSPEGLAVLREGLNSADPAMRRTAVRAAGRLERPELLALIAPRLADPDASVRREAANAAGQVAVTAAAVADVQARLLRRLEAEPDERVWGVAAQTLGRLRYTRAEHVEAAERALQRALPDPPEVAEAAGAGSAAPVFPVHLDAALGAVKGFEALARQTRTLQALSADTLTRLRTTAQLGGRDERLVRLRRLAWLALTHAGAADGTLVGAGLADEDGEVRRLAAAAAGSDAALPDRPALLARGLGDAHAPVRYEALRGWARHVPADCTPIARAIDDPDPHVALLAIDLAGGCPAGAAPEARVRAVAGELPAGTGAWHRAARAIVALARVAPAEARAHLPRFAAHETWQVRMYAARAAAALEDDAALAALARDAHDNVREAALTALAARGRPEAVPLAVEALGRPDYQLVRTAARALRDRARRGEILPALIDALDRITAERKDTSRDPRLAILEAIGELAWPDGAGLAPAQVDALRPYLRDFDPRVAARAAELLEAWTRMPHAAQPQPLPRPPVSRAAVDALAGAHLRLVMEGGGVVELRLLVDEAPLSALRVATLARRGYYDGLTFHRVAPNFVIQGGSPGANEYAGDGPYMRDEVGLVSHRRGTVGISTRGRDTGDAQIFVNLVDSPRLDHTYTVFAEVVRGMDVVDGILEGAVIARAEVVAR